MKYVFDTGVFINIFRHYYRGRFPSFWEQFDKAVKDRRIMSTREVFKELERRADDALAWAKNHKTVFPEPQAKEMEFVAEIFSNHPHFQQIVTQRKQLEGGSCADPFIIAKARIEKRVVATTEKCPPHGARIPNICNKYGIRWVDLEKFMQQEDWKF